MPRIKRKSDRRTFERRAWVDLTDGCTLGVPLEWFPRLLRATPAQRQSYRISPSGEGLHREALDEDVSVPGLLAGRGDATARRRAIA